MTELTVEEISARLAAHGKWLRREECGERANLQGAYLWGANLQGANLQGANLEGANLEGANLQRANLACAKLWGANLQGADLRDADLRDAKLQGATGNMREVKSLQIDTWAVTYTAEILQIGCQKHPIADWRNASPEWIAKMDNKATDWWAKFGPIILQIIDASPATAQVQS